MDQGLEDSATHPVWRGVKITVGLILLPLGVVGLFLPILQGVVFLLIAVALLSTEVPFVARLRDRIRHRYPGPWKKAEEFGRRLKVRFRGDGAHR